MVQTVFLLFSGFLATGLEALTEESIEFFHFGKPLQ